MTERDIRFQDGVIKMEGAEDVAFSFGYMSFFPPGRLVNPRDVGLLGFWTPSSERRFEAQRENKIIWPLNKWRTQRMGKIASNLEESIEDFVFQDIPYAT